MNGGLKGISNGPVNNLLQSPTTNNECNEENVRSSQSRTLELTNELKESETRLKSMEVDLRARDAVISELESRITSYQMASSLPNSNTSLTKEDGNNSLSIEVLI